MYQARSSKKGDLLDEKRSDTGVEGSSVHVTHILGYQEGGSGLSVELLLAVRDEGTFQFPVCVAVLYGHMSEKHGGFRVQG